MRASGLPLLLLAALAVAAGHGGAAAAAAAATPSATRGWAALTARIAAAAAGGGETSASPLSWTPPDFCHGIDCPPFEVKRTLGAGDDALALRCYAAATWATTTVASLSYDEAVRAGFWVRPTGSACRCARARALLHPPGRQTTKGGPPAGQPNAAPISHLAFRPPAANPTKPSPCPAPNTCCSHQHPTPPKT